MAKRQTIFLALAFGLLLNCRFVNGVLLQPGSEAADYGVDRDTSIFLAEGQPLTLDPARTQSGPDSPLGHIFSGLVRLNTQLQVEPDLAAGWHISSDGLIYTFYLRPNAVFHDGRSVTAADLVYSWERATDPALDADVALTYLGDIVGVRQKIAGQASQISGLRMVDDHTVEVQLIAPSYTFLARLAFPVAYVVDSQNVAQPGWEHQPNGTGPFKLQIWRDDDIIILARNDAYYLEPAHISHLVFLLGPDFPLARYERDEIDMVWVGGDALARLQNPADPLAGDLQTAVPLCTSYLGLNSRQPPFDDVRVRQAFNYALDKALLVETFWRGSGLPATGVLPPGMPGYSDQLVGYPFDLRRARELLTAAGYGERDANGRLSTFPPLTFVTSGYNDASEFVTAVITMWQKNLGVTIEPVVIDPYTYLDELAAGNVGNVFSSSWCADYPDPENFLDVLFHSQSPQNLGGFSDPALDAALEAARQEMVVPARLARYAAIEQTAVAQAPLILLAHNVAHVLLKPAVSGYVVTPIGVAQWHRVTRQAS